MCSHVYQFEVVILPASSIRFTDHKMGVWANKRIILLKLRYDLVYLSLGVKERAASYALVYT